MKRLVLKRIVKNEEGTFGVLIQNNIPFAVTGELPDLCNQRNISCIPEDDYICFKRTSEKYGEVFQVDNVPNRSGILFHKGNIPSNDSQGCILVAEAFNVLGNEQAVTDSKGGYADFMDTVGDDSHFHLSIIDVSFS